MPKLNKTRWVTPTLNSSNVLTHMFIPIVKFHIRARNSFSVATGNYKGKSISRKFYPKSQPFKIDSQQSAAGLCSAAQVNLCHRNLFSKLTLICERSRLHHMVSNHERRGRTNKMDVYLWQFQRKHHPFICTRQIELERLIFRKTTPMGGPQRDVLQEVNYHENLLRKEFHAGAVKQYSLLGLSDRKQRNRRRCLRNVLSGINIPT